MRGVFYTYYILSRFSSSESFVSFLHEISSPEVSVLMSVSSPSDEFSSESSHLSSEAVISDSLLVAISVSGFSSSSVFSGSGSRITTFSMRFWITLFSVSSKRMIGQNGKNH